MAPLFPGCDYEHWLIVMDERGGEGATKQEMVDCYIQTLAKVVGRMVDMGKRGGLFTKTKASNKREEEEQYYNGGAAEIILQQRGKLPCTLTQTFRSMLQNGMDLSTVDVSYVSSLSW